MRVQILIPAHSSSLAYFDKHLFDGKSCCKDTNCVCIGIQGCGDGLIWNGLRPLLVGDFSEKWNNERIKIASIACSILIGKFWRYWDRHTIWLSQGCNKDVEKSLPISRNDETNIHCKGFGYLDIDTIYSQNNSDSGSILRPRWHTRAIELDEEAFSETLSNSCHTRNRSKHTSSRPFLEPEVVLANSKNDRNLKHWKSHENVIDSSKDLNSDAHDKTNLSFSYSSKGHQPIDLILLIFPPYYIQSSSSLRPEKSFSSKLVKLENLQIRLQTLNAYIATLGGGYFLCRYLSTAVNLARYQRCVALALGDHSLADKCTINEAYNYIHAGRIPQAIHLIQNVMSSSKNRNDSLVLSMSRSALWFAKKVEKASLYDHGSNVVRDSEKQSFKCNTSRNCGISNGCILAYGSSSNIPSKILHHGKNFNPIKTSSSDDYLSCTVDDFQRIRIVRDRSLQDVRANKLLSLRYG
mmetsp:Transcript_16881/g.23892  ORF Transcript_16881/g.23892 Transcript_16881/m.23892 type:complete len:466 (+) Transcript_16881:182-1579(+)